MPFDQHRIQTFRDSLNDTRPWNGLNAKNWGEHFLEDLPAILDRRFVRNDLLDANFKEQLTNEQLSIVVLSWGGMNRRHGESLFQHEEWFDIVGSLRNGELNRQEAYDEFMDLRNRGLLKGMGPAFFTKLICFINRDINGYIMDQWTAKSMNLLLGVNLIDITRQGTVSDNNNSAVYERFCEWIEKLAEEIQLDPLETEEALFSYGGRRKGAWRRYVITEWDHMLTNM